MKPAPSRFEVSIGLSRAGLEVSLSDRWLAPGIRLEGLVGQIAARPTRISSQDLEAHLYQSRIRVTQTVVEVECGTLQRAAMTALCGAQLPIEDKPGQAATWSVCKVLLLPRFPDHDAEVEAPCLAVVGTSSDGAPISLWVGLNSQISGRQLELSPGRLWVTGLAQADAHAGLQILASRLSRAAFFSLAEVAESIRVDPGAALLVPAWLAMGWQVLDLAATSLHSVVVADGVARFELRAQATAHLLRQTTQPPDPIGETLARVVCLAEGDAAACEIGLRALAEVSEHVDHCLFIDTLEAWRVQIAGRVSPQARLAALGRWCDRSPANATARCLYLGALATSGVSAQVEALRRARALPGTKVQQVLRELAWGMSLLMHGGDAKAARRVLEPVAHTLLRDTPTGWLTAWAWGAVVRARAEDEDVVCEGVLQALARAQASYHHPESSPDALQTRASWLVCATEAASARWSAPQVEDVRRILDVLGQHAPPTRENPWVFGLAQAPQPMLAHLVEEPVGPSSVRRLCAYAWLVKLQRQRKQDPGDRELIQHEATCRAALREFLGSELSPGDFVEEASIVGFGLGRSHEAIDLLVAAQSRWPKHRGIRDTLGDLRGVMTSPGEDTHTGEDSMA